MSCLSIRITTHTHGSLKVTTTPHAVLGVGEVVGRDARVRAERSESAKLSINERTEPARLTCKTMPGAKLTVGEICSVSDDTIVVLAGSDGPLRTKDGGFFLLDPKTN